MEKPNPDAVLKLWVIRTQLRNRGQEHSRKAEYAAWRMTIRCRKDLLPPIAAIHYVNP